MSKDVVRKLMVQLTLNNSFTSDISSDWFRKRIGVTGGFVALFGR